MDIQTIRLKIYAFRVHPGHFSAQESMKQQLHNMLEVPQHVNLAAACGSYDPGRIQMVVTPRAVRWAS